MSDREAVALGIVCIIVVVAVAALSWWYLLAHTWNGS